MADVLDLPRVFNYVVKNSSENVNSDLSEKDVNLAKRAASCDFNFRYIMALKGVIEDDFLMPTVLKMSEDDRDFVAQKLALETLYLGRNPLIIKDEKIWKVMETLLSKLTLINGDVIVAAQNYSANQMQAANFSLKKYVKEDGLSYEELLEKRIKRDAENFAYDYMNNLYEAQNCSYFFMNYEETR